MLAALLMLGVLPMAALPFLQEESASDDDDTTNASEDGTISTNGIGNILDPETGSGPAGPGLVSEVMNGSSGPNVPLDPVDPDDPNSDPGDVYTLDATPDDVVISDFDPNADTLVFDLSTHPGELFLETSDDPEGPILTLDFGSHGTTTVQFPGLKEVPGGDIFLRLMDETTGEPFELSLTDAMTLQNFDVSNVIDPADPGAVTAPTDPTTPGEPGPVTGPGVAPTNPALPTQPGPGLQPGSVLQPVNPETPVYGPEGEQTLRGLLERDSGSSGDLGAVLHNSDATGTADTILDTGDDVFTQPDDGVTQSTSLSLEEGAPVIHATGPLAVVDGGLGNDSVSLGTEPGYAFGGDGDDTLTSGTGDAALYGGQGDDSLVSDSDAASRAFLEGGAGNDTIIGGDGDDILEGGEHAGTGVGDDLISGGAGNDLIRGGLGSDTLLGGDGDDVIDHAGRDLERQGVMQNEFSWHIDDANDVLIGGAGDDTLIFDQGDLASGGTGEDLFWVYHDGDAGSDAAIITDFEVGEDFLRVSLNPNIGENGDPDVVVEASPNGEDGHVIVNGDLVAILRGAPTATSSDIYAEVRQDVFS